MKKYWYDYKTVIISGCASGIGKGIAKRLIEENNCTVIGIDLAKDKLVSFKNELGNKAHYFSYHCFDVSVKENWQALAISLKENNTVPDMLINNAGILPKFDRFTNYKIESVEKAMAINFYASLYSIDALMPLITQSEYAAVVNVSSSAALCSLAGTSVYSASKGALKSFTDALREEYRGRCYVGLVCPGFTKTNIFSNQNKAENPNDHLINYVSTDCNKMVDMIITGILKKKENMIFGADAHAMDIGYKMFGTFCCNAASKVIKKANLSMFSEVF